MDAKEEVETYAYAFYKYETVLFNTRFVRGYF